jgi:spermidine/putrescine transport system permease protein
MNVASPGSAVLPSRARRRRPTTALAFLVPPTTWLVFFFVLPMVVMLLFSFRQTVNFKIIPSFTLANYANLLKPLYASTFARTVRISLMVTAISVVLGYPVAYFLARKVHRFRTVLLMLVILPLWTSYLVRTFAWILLLGTNGVINYGLRGLGLIHEPLPWLLYSDFAVTIALVHIYMPFMILPLYAVLEKLDSRLLEAAADLGAGAARTFLHITLPLSLSGLITGCLFVFIPSMGAFVTPELLGGTRSILIGSIIAQQFGVAFEYPFGSAMALALMAMILTVATVALRYSRLRGLV